MSFDVLFYFMENMKSLWDLEELTFFKIRNTAKFVVTEFSRSKKD